MPKPDLPLIRRRLLYNTLRRTLHILDTAELMKQPLDAELLITAALPHRKTAGTAREARTTFAPRVLVLYSDERLLLSNVIFDHSFRTTLQAGTSKRWACDKHLRHAIYLFAEQSLSRCVWAELYYQYRRQKDRTHANAIRRLGDRWLKIIHKMRIDRTPYNAELHHQNQLQHGSWIFQLEPS